jgi:hypothetical protein
MNCFVTHSWKFVKISRRIDNILTVGQHTATSDELLLPGAINVYDVMISCVDLLVAVEVNNAYR